MRHFRKNFFIGIFVFLRSCCKKAAQTMRFGALKYALVFIIPILFVFGWQWGGALTFAPVLFAFGAIPLFELLFAPDPRNADAAEKEMMQKDRIYDLLLYLVPLSVYACIALYLFALSTGAHSTLEWVGLSASLAVVMGGLGINVAHELGHRNTAFERFLAKMLLLPTGYMHFFIEHNYGHHRNVGTYDDPATARFGESLYAFWLRSLSTGYRSAWQLERERMKRKKQPYWSLHNEMLRFQLMQMAWWLLILLLFGWQIALVYTAAALGAVLLLETVNYIEHYGLSRNKVSDSRYERVRPVHSWNSNHYLGRLMLFELSRHSDHHYQPAKPYPLLDHHADSPQMPTGYPGMMLLSTIPPLWFYIMHKKLDGVEAGPAIAA